jgi:hypothetical protein
VAVALKLDADDPAALGEPREYLAEASVERQHPAVEGDERRAVEVPVLLIPERQAIDVSGGHGRRQIPSGIIGRRR